MDLWAFTPFIRFFCDFVAEAFYISLQYIPYDFFYCAIVATDLTYGGMPLLFCATTRKNP